MRILHVTDNYAPAVGGLERYVRNLAEWQVGQGHDVTILTLRRADSPDRAPDPEVAGVAVIRVPSARGAVQPSYAAEPHQFLPPFPDPVFARGARRAVRELRPDLVHAHSWAVRSLLVGVVPPDVALVQTLHEYGSVCAIQTYTREPVGCPEGPGLRRCLECATAKYGAPVAGATVLGMRASQPLLGRVDRFVAVSDYVGAVASQGLPSDRIAVVPTFVPVGLPGLAADAPRPSWLPSRYVAYVGALTPHKGVDVLLDAWSRLGDDRPDLVLCGPRRPETPDLERPGVVVRENVPHAGVMATWRGAAAGVVPSTWPEPFGQVAVEGMAAGCPMVVAETGGLGDIVAGGFGLTFPPGDADALRNRLRDVLDDPALASRMAALGPARAEEFDLDHVGPRLMGEYDQALRRRRERRG